jgi:3,4-dihydroxy-2-butanone 4-phosphate synthase
VKTSILQNYFLGNITAWCIPLAQADVHRLNLKVMMQQTIYRQDTKYTVVKATVVKENVKVATHEVTLKRTLDTETNTAGISWKQVAALPQNRVRWQFLEETVFSTYKLQY